MSLKRVCDFCGCDVLQGSDEVSRVALFTDLQQPAKKEKDCCRSCAETWRRILERSAEELDRMLNAILVR